MVVTFEKPSKRSNENFRDEYKVNYKAPVHKALLEQKEKLTAHLRDICRLHEDVKDEEVSLSEISSNAYDQFVLKGTVRSYGATVCPLKTANIQDGTGYNGFLDVLEIIGDLYDEVRSYIHVDKKAQVDLTQLAMDFATRDKKADLDAIGEMNDEQKAMYAREYLESKGCIVIEFEDPGDGGEGKVSSNDDQTGVMHAEIEPESKSGDEESRFSDENKGDQTGVMHTGNPYPGSQEESDLYAKENPYVEPIPEQPGFGQAPVGGTVIPINQPQKDPDDMGEVRKRARKIN